VGIAWIVAALVILQFDAASVATIGVIVGIMFAAASAPQFALAVVADRLRWLWAVFGVLFGASAIICFVHPENTFAALADVLGFVFVCVGVWWMLRAFLLKATDATWWFELVAGVLMHGVLDIVAAFRVRNLNNAA
jgi:uncharacterized membrane protein HdeD (DUF308 family)